MQTPKRMALGLVLLCQRPTSELHTRHHKNFGAKSRTYTRSPLSGASLERYRIGTMSRAMYVSYDQFIRHHERVGNRLTVWVRPETPRGVREDLADMLERVDRQAGRHIPLSIVITDDALEVPIQLSFPFMEKVTRGPGRG